MLPLETGLESKRFARPNGEHDERHKVQEIAAVLLYRGTDKQRRIIQDVTYRGVRCRPNKKKTL